MTEDVVILDVEGAEILIFESGDAPDVIDGQEEVFIVSVGEQGPAGFGMPLGGTDNQLVAKDGPVPGVFKFIDPINSAVWGGIIGTLADQTDLQAALDTLQSEIDGIQGSTNLAYTAAADHGVVTSDTGTDATIPAATDTEVGLMLPAQVTQLAGLGTASTHAATDFDAAGAAASAQSSAEAYAESLVVGLWDDRGNYDASSNTFPASGGSGTAGAILKGDIYNITVAGTLGGVPVVSRQTVRAMVDTPGQTAGNWAIGLANADIDDSITDGITGRAPSENAVYDALALRDTAITSLSTSTSTGLSTATSGLTSLSTSTSTGLSTVTSGLTSLSTSTSTSASSLSTALSTTNSSLTSLSTSASVGLSTGVSSLTSLSTSTSTGLSTATSSITSLSTSASAAISTGTSSLTSLSTSTSTGLSTATSGIVSLSTSASSLSTSASTGLSTATSSITSLSTSTSTGLAAAALLTGNTYTGTETVSLAVGAASTDGMVLATTVAATSGNQKRSPRLRFTGSGWMANSGVAQQSDVTIEARPIQSSTSSFAMLGLSAQIAGGGFTDFMSLGPVPGNSTSFGLWKAGITPSNTNFSFTHDTNAININAVTSAWPVYLGGGNSYGFGASGTTVFYGSTVVAKFNSTGGADGSSPDLGYSRNAAGVLEINSSVAGTFRDLKLRNLLAQAGVVTLASFTVATLPSASTSGAGALAMATDLISLANGGTATNGGSLKGLCKSDGTNWIVLG